MPLSPFHPPAPLRQALYRFSWFSSFLCFPFLPFRAVSQPRPSLLFLPLVPALDAQYSCLVSQRERSMISFIARCRRALNPPRKRSPCELFSSERPLFTQEEGKRIQCVFLYLQKPPVESHAGYTFCTTVTCRWRRGASFPSASELKLQS